MAPKVHNTAERSLGQLVADVSTDLSMIVKGEIELAKMEIKEDVKRGGTGGALLAVAGVLALFGLSLLLGSLAWALASAFDSPALGHLAAGGIVFLVVLILALVGVMQLKKVKGKPVEAIKDAQATAEILKKAKP